MNRCGSNFRVRSSGLTDALERHLRADQLTDWSKVKSPSPTSIAICQSYSGVIEQLDLPRCGDRARGMALAVQAIIDHREDTHVLNLQLLTTLHSLAVPQGRLREQEMAFAKSGQERYSHRPKLLDQRLRLYSHNIRLASALRAYLDLCFFHPYSDGNARAARLAFTWYACRAQLSFKSLGPLFALSIPAGNLRAYELFISIANRVIRC